MQIERVINTSNNNNNTNNIINNTGPHTEPRGTPLNTDFQLEKKRLNTPFVFYQIANLLSI